MLKETQGWKAESKHLGQERAAGMRMAENLWHTMKLSPEGAALHPAAGDALGSQGALSVPCENGFKSPQANPVLTPPVLLSALTPQEAMAVPFPGQHTPPAGGKVHLGHVVLPELSSTQAAPTAEHLCPWSMFWFALWN